MEDVGLGARVVRISFSFGSFYVMLKVFESLKR